MATSGEEFIIGRVATETDYDPSWSTPTWAELGNLLARENIDEFAIVPLGKVYGRQGGKREFGSTSVVVTAADVAGALTAVTEEVMRSGLIAGDANDPSQVFGASAIISLDSRYTNELTERLCRLIHRPEHITGFAIKAIR